MNRSDQIHYATLALIDSWDNTTLQEYAYEQLFQYYDCCSPDEETLHFINNKKYKDKPWGEEEYTYEDNSSIAPAFRMK